LTATLYCPKVFSPCTTCRNTASLGAAIVVLYGFTGYVMSELVTGSTSI